VKIKSLIIITLVICTIALIGALLLVRRDNAASQAKLASPAPTATTTPSPTFSPKVLLGSDYTITDVQYFDANEWAVAVAQFQSNPDNIMYAVFRLQDNTYTLVAGPGTDIRNGLPAETPPDVTKYISDTNLLE
jgi:hypothetical protein